MQRLTQYVLRGGIGLVGGLLLWIGAGGLAYAGHYPAEMVSATKHNLSANVNIQFGSLSTTGGSSEVCVYCHTPHGAGYSSMLNRGMAPLWNRLINTGTAYTTYASLNSPHFESSSTTTANAEGGIKGVSLACLSCHDGSIAFDALINLQGSGGYQAANTTQGAGPGDHSLADALFIGFGGNAVDTTNHTFSTTFRSGSSGDPFGGSLASNDTLATAGTRPFPNLGLDLSDDHPISFEIPTTDPQFDEMVAGAVVDTGNLLYLKRNLGAGEAGILPADKRDRIRAYPSTGATLASATAAGAYIECASCHNPHTPRTLFLRLPSNVSDTGNFSSTTGGAGLLSGGGTASAAAAGVPLGVDWSHAPNQASAICVSCHQK